MCLLLLPILAMPLSIWPRQDCAHSFLPTRKSLPTVKHTRKLPHLQLMAALMDGPRSLVVAVQPTELVVSLLSVPAALQWPQ